MKNISKYRSVSGSILILILFSSLMFSGCNLQKSKNPEQERHNINESLESNTDIEPAAKQSDKAVADSQRDEGKAISTDGNGGKMDSIINRLISGEAVQGEARDDPSGKCWNFRLSIHTFDPTSGAISGKIEWPDLNAVHKIQGRIDKAENKLAFEETDYIEKGKAYLGAEYTMMAQGGKLEGIWYDKENNQEGSFSFFDKHSVTATIDADNAVPYEYGYSGYKEPLIVYRIANNPQSEKGQKILCVFAIHGFEDAFYKDGRILVDIAADLIDYYADNPEELEEYELLVIPCANPDGLSQGWTCNGPGRCQVSQGIDINMDFDYSFQVRYNKRNKTGEQAFTSPEARALKELVIEEKPDIIIDFHGWINCAAGDKEIADIFCKHLGLTYQEKEKAIFKGFFSGWAAQYARTVLVEYPDPIRGEGVCNLKSDQKYDYSQEKLDELKYSEKTIKAIKEIIDCEL